MRFGGILLAAAVLLGACSSDPEPQEPTATPTPTSTATLPAMPDQATEDSPEGAAAFVDHWVDVFNYASQTGDVDELNRLSSPDCEGCRSYIEVVTKTYSRGGKFVDGDWILEDIQVRPGESDSLVTALLVRAPGQYQDGRESTLAPTEGGRDSVTFTVTPGASRLVSALSLGAPK